MNRKDLITSHEYVVGTMQLRLLNMIEEYMKKNKIKRAALAQKLDVTKGYISQILNVAYDHKISKLTDLALACDKIPLLYFVDINEYVENDNNNVNYHLMALGTNFIHFGNKNTEILDVPAYTLPVNTMSHQFEVQSTKTVSINKAILTQSQVSS